MGLTALLSGLVLGLAVAAQDPADALARAVDQVRRGKEQFRVGRLDEAATLTREALSELERHRPRSELAMSEAMLILGAICGVQGDLAAAAGHYRRALDLRLRHDPPGAPYLQLLRFNLAASLQALSDDAAAVEIAAAALRELPQTAASPLAGNLHGVFALACDGLGRYQEALQHYGEAIARLTPSYGPTHVDVLRLQGLMGAMQCRLGQPALGLAQLDAAVAALRRAATAPAGLRAEIETAHAVMHLIHGGGEQAVADVRRQLQSAIHDSRNSVPGAAGRVILLMSALACERADPGDSSLVDDALARCAADYGDNHPYLAGVFCNASRLHLDRDEPDTASQLLDRAIAILDANPTYLAADRWKTYWSRAVLDWRAGQVERAEKLFRRMLDELPGMLEAWSTPLDEGERRELTAAARAAVDGSIVLARQLDRPTAEVWQPVLAWRALVARGFLQSLEWLQLHRDPGAQTLAQELRAALAEVERQRRLGVDRSGFAGAVAQREQAASRLAQRLTARSSTVPTAAELMAAIEPGEVWIDYWVHGAVTPVPDRQFAAEERVLAYVTGHDGRGELVDLGPLAEIAAAVDAFRRAASRWTTPSATAEQTILAAGQRLSALVWQPLSPRVPLHSRVLMTPDSVLALVPWACLPGRDGRSFLVEEHEIVQVADPADLLTRSQWSRLEPTQVLTTVGGVDYGTGEFRALPSSGAEASAVVAAFRAAGGSAVRSLSGATATAEAFAAAATGATYVHVATHGWFRGSHALPELDRRWRGFEFGGKALSRTAISPGTDSGIALAGATAPGGRERGCLTTEDLARLDLARCELAVLSACESGLGTVSAGDGLLGLRRAVRLAGARRSLTSVWRIDDAAAERCMVAFYEALWARGQPPSTALRTAQLAMLAAARTTNGQALTGLWGGFVLESR